MKNTNWIVALVVGALGFVGGQACINKSGTTSSGTKAMGSDQGKAPADLPPGFLKETDLPAGTLAGLTEQQKYSVLKAINEKPCTCGCSNDTIAKCRKNDPTCTTSPKLIDQAIALAKQGQSAMQIEASFGGGAPGKAAPQGPQEDLAYYRVPIGNSPTEGPATAKVTIVEATDFQ